MDINNELLSRIIGGDSSSKVNILNWNITEDIIQLGHYNRSCLSRLMVEYQKKGKIFKKSFILKIPSTHPMYSVFNKYRTYDKEFPVYTTVLEEMYKIDGEHIGPRLYYTNEKNSLILKDLSQSGYKLMYHTEQLDYDQCSVVVRNLAKFHALSVKLEKMSKLSAEVKELAWVEYSLEKKNTTEFLENAVEKLAKCVEPKFKLTEKILRFKENIYQSYCEGLSSSRFSFNVLNHGDCWTGNLLFKLDKYANVKKVKFIDFQYSFWTTPAYDLLIFAITSMQFEVFEKYFDILMETYIKTLNRTLRYLQCGSYTIEELRHDMDSFKAHVIVALSVHLPECVSSHEYRIDNRNICEKGKWDYSQYYKMYDNEIYCKLLNKWIAYYIDKGFFDQ